MQTRPQPRDDDHARLEPAPRFDLIACRRMDMDQLLHAAESAGLEEIDHLDRRALVFALQTRTQGADAEARGLGEGLLQVHPDGFGFLRAPEDEGRPGADDIYVSPNQIQRLRLRPGHRVTGVIRLPRAGEQYFALVRVDTVEGVPLAARGREVPFRHLRAVLPHRRMQVESAGGAAALRLVDLATPLAWGQRVLVRTPPTAPRHRLLDELAGGIRTNHGDAELLVLLVDQRPEDAAGCRDRLGDAPRTAVFASTFDEAPSRQLEMFELVRARAERLVEGGRDVVLLLDSLTQLVRLGNNTLPHSGKIIAALLDAAALQRPKELFAAARQTETAGSLTVVATLLTDTGVAMDQAIDDEFAGTASARLTLSARLAELDLYPPLALSGCGTDWADHLLPAAELHRRRDLRRSWGGDDETALRQLLEAVKATSDNADLLARIRTGD